MIAYSKNNLREIHDLLSVMSEDDYIRPSSLLSDSTIGQHIRHIVEFYQCLLQGYDEGIVIYDKRKRDNVIETNVSVAGEALIAIIDSLDRADKALFLEYELNKEKIILQSTYTRELMHNLDHSIHHMALIKIAVNELTTIKLSHNFGVAPATIQYREECAL